MYRTLLVPLDGSVLGEQALSVALNIARRAGASLVLAHVHVAGRSLFATELAIPGDTLDRQARAAEQAYLEQLAQRSAKDHGIHIEVALLDGLVADALSERARSADVDLIVMSTHGRGALGQIWLGSVAAALARSAPAPLLLVRPRKAPRPPASEAAFDHVLVPLDGSRLAEQVLEPAIELGALTQARYTLLQALDPLVVRHTQPPYAAGLDRRLVAEVQEQAAAYLEHIAAGLRARSLDVQTDLVVGPPAFSIRDYAHAHDVDLIAMATHGHGGISRLLLGSVTDAVVHSAGIPILLHRPSGEVV